MVGHGESNKQKKKKRFWAHMDTRALWKCAAQLQDIPGASPHVGDMGHFPGHRPDHPHWWTLTPASDLDLHRAPPLSDIELSAGVGRYLVPGQVVLAAVRAAAPGFHLLSQVTSR